MAVVIEVEARRADSQARRALTVALALGVLFDLLLWRQQPGLGLTLFLCALLAAVAHLAQRSGRTAGLVTRAVLGTAVLLAVAVSLRSDPVTVALNVLAVCAATVLVAHGYTDAAWRRYRTSQWLRAGRQLVADALAGPLRLVAALLRDRAPRAHRTYERWLPVGRGILVATPIVVLFGLLLASADAVFADRLAGLTNLLSRLEPGEAAVRVLIVGSVAFVLAGAFAHLLRERAGAPDEGGGRPLGLTEALTVLGAVNLLFLAFVVFQVRYLFGGGDTLATTGLTYAEYARRGFAELLVVAAISLVLQVGLGALTRREHPLARRAFTLSSVALSLLVLVIVASAFQRLLLYEAAFGFTRARMLAHVFMVWLGVLLVAVAAAEALDRLRYVSLLCAAAGAGVVLTLTAVGVDGLVARHNLDRARAGAELDTWYLAGLSAEVVPVLAEALPHLDHRLARAVKGVLACRQVRPDSSPGWRSAHLADVRAQRALSSLAGELDGEVCPLSRAPAPIPGLP